ncbi:MAG: tRNA (N(6)-L-threonylcarbamoyladenosine(37)-C(2))-methylthiotransferase MtaB [Clostridiales bacterium]|jgi:threonylcarbamoyladenosine tRNA methylthiotransferase MtaB|nr:tRNA (N(6)-L-threonylcarbamoyladenosine(37)-C(2))-methylthiotransferase MtaB [Clostridiales bacterium]
MRASVLNLGCKVNFYDSEKIKKVIIQNGILLVEFKNIADIYIINTCSVTQMSDKKSRQMISRARSKNVNSIIIAMGCYAKLNKAYLLENQIADYVCSNIDELEKIIIDLKKNLEVYNHKDNNTDNKLNLKIKTKKRFRAFIKIQDGCNNFCSYCVIPYARGLPNDRDINEILDEVNYLCDNENIKEIVLTGINISSYKKLIDLIKELNNIKKLLRIRISSIEVNLLNDFFINKIKTFKKLCPHFHIPLQSGSNKILKSMNRKYDTDFFYDSIQKIKSIENISITTDIIVGFPDETDEDFNDTYNFIKKINFFKIHVFPYSQRKNTKAINFKNQVNESIKKYRSKKIIKLSSELSKNFIKSMLNKTFEVLIEENKNEFYFGYTDNYIKIKVKSNSLKINDIVKVRIGNIITEPPLEAEILRFF